MTTAKLGPLLRRGVAEIIVEQEFQEMGHQVILIVGDWTAQIGDPSGESVTRPMLTAEQVKSNAETYLQQFFKVVDKEKTEVKWQSEWFGNFDLADVVRLTSKFTVAQFLAREDFGKRYREGRPIAITELLYPLLQAYDSVAIEADVEFGGIDQKFNCLVGRELQAMIGQRPQQIFLVPLLVGTDGTKKMSKSLGNYVGVTDPPNDMYGKLMSIPDDLIIPYFELLTDVPDAELGEMAQQIESGSVNDAAAKDAAEYFVRVVQRKEVPEEDILLHRTRLADSVKVDDVLLATKLVKSRSEARRLLTQGAIELDGEKVGSNVVTACDGSVLKVGKRRFVKLIDTPG